MTDWNYDTKTYINVNDDDVAHNLVRDLFFDRDGEMTIGEWQEIWSTCGAGIVHTSIGHTALVTPELANKALRSFIEDDHPFVFIEDEQRIVWPIQKAMAR